MVFFYPEITKQVSSTWENVPSGMCARRRLKSAYASLQSDQSLRRPHEETSHPWLFKSARWRFRSACAFAQADLNLRWAQMSEDTFSDVAAQMLVPFSILSPAAVSDEFLSIHRIWSVWHCGDNRKTAAGWNGEDTRQCRPKRGFLFRSRF